MEINPPACHTGYFSEERAMIAPGRYYKITGKQIQRGMPVQSSSKHAAPVQSVDINADLRVMLAANLLNLEEKCHPPRYITKTDPFITKYTALRGNLQPKKMEDHLCNPEKEHSGIRKTELPIAVTVYTNESAQKQR